MSRPIIQVRGLAKRYQLGRIGFTSLRAEVERWWARRRGSAAAGGGAAGDFWALRDVELRRRTPARSLGVIGRNGAGKSTLLKILSRITEPTTGRITLNGRVASLLEVGTGFHPELTGRENIFLNGAILGMSRVEIKSKFDEIVAFAEVERFLDTPVKRYSSGMYVRLAFAVAAHLEPEILVIDEVLAVGDAEFQKKCLGKMKNVVSHEGRTVLFVSHNLRVAAYGAAPEVVGRYLAGHAGRGARWERPADQALPPVAGFVRVAAAAPARRGPSFRARDDRARMRRAGHDRAPGCCGPRSSTSSATNSSARGTSTAANPARPAPGRRLRARCTFPGGLLRPGRYGVTVSASEVAGDRPVALYEELVGVVRFEVSPQGYQRHAPRRHGGAPPPSGASARSEGRGGTRRGSRACDQSAEAPAKAEAQRRAWPGARPTGVGTYRSHAAIVLPWKQHPRRRTG
jgi:ABC-type polysaccharide/polyol phosphate transport system ATPase subunit